MFPYYTLKNLFFAELINRNLHIPELLFMPLALGSVFLIWKISKKILGDPDAYLAVLTVILSPWLYYLVIAHSFYIFLLFIILLSAYGIIQIISGRSRLGSSLVIIGSVAAVYSSLLLLLILPIIFTSLIYLRIIPFNKLKTSIILVVILSLPLLLFIGKNKDGFRNTFTSEVKIFSDPGLINSINRYQGAANKDNLKYLSRVAENKYLFFSEYVLLKYSSQVVPETYFTPKYMLLGFSFSPPIFIGFIIPFVYGLYIVLTKPDFRKILLVSTLLTIPSIFSKDLVALNRLVIFSPVIFLLIAYGLGGLYKQRKSKTIKVFLTLTCVLIMFQLIVTIGDIRSREGLRYIQYFGSNYKLKEP